MLISITLLFLPCCRTNITNKILSWAKTAMACSFDIFLNKEPNDVTNPSVYTVSGYKAPSFYTIILSILHIQLIAVAAVQFCDVFLIEESFGCDVNGPVCCYMLR